MKATKLTALLALLLSAALLLAGCDNAPAATTTTTQGSSTPVSTSGPASSDENTTSEATSSPVPGSTAPDVLPDTDLEELANAIYNATSVEFPSVINSTVDLSDQNRFRFVFGIDVPGSAVSALASEPLIGSIPYTMALLKLDDTSDIERIAASIEKGVNPSKWVCVTASTVKTAYKGNVILLVMDKDAARANVLIDSFLEVMD